MSRTDLRAGQRNDLGALWCAVAAFAVVTGAISTFGGEARGEKNLGFDEVLDRVEDARSRTSAAGAQFRFRHHFGDSDLKGRNMGQTALADLTGNGKLDFITGEQRGDIFWYEYRAADDWVRHVLGRNSPSPVGGAAMDVNGNGRMDFVTGGVWFENPGNPTEQEFIRNLFDPDLGGVHDMLLGDISGDGKLDVVTMSTRNGLRWYRVSDNPKDRWIATDIGEGVYSGLALGDITGNGEMDVVRSDVWYENLGAGREWKMHRMIDPWTAPDPPVIPNATQAENATRTEVLDVNGNGRLDVLICDGENPNSRIGWLEAPADPREEGWKFHSLPRSDDDPRGALHSLRVADFNNNGRLEILAVEMELYPGKRPPRWFIWENVDGQGTFVEHVILDANLGGHETVVGDVDGDGDIDIVSKPWRPNPNNANEGRSHFSYLENLTIGR